MYLSFNVDDAIKYGHFERKDFPINKFNLDKIVAKYAFILKCALKILITFETIKKGANLLNY